MDELFGFAEYQPPGSPQFWLDHERAVFLTHSFDIDASNAIRKGVEFFGVLRLREQLTHPFREIGCIDRKAHDVWSVGNRLICGTHGEHCIACDIAQQWLDKQILNCWTEYPLATPDGRIFLAGCCMVPGDEIFKRKLE